MMDGEGSNSCEAEPVEAQRDDHDEFEAVPSTVDDFDMLRKSLSNLKDIAGKNAHYFGSRPNYNQSQEKFHTLFTNIATSAESTELLCEPLIAGCAVFDGTPYTHANGFRSLLQMVTAVVSGLISQSQFCEANCASPFFFSGTALELLRSQLDALKGMSRLIILAQDLMNTLVNGDLFPESQAVSEDLLTQSQNIPRDCFYGHCLGIHYVPSIKPVVQSLSVAMASYGEGFLRHKNQDQGGASFANSMRVAMSSVWHGAGFVLNHARRASQIVSLTQSRDIHFTKAFWSLAEVSAMQQMAELVIPGLAVNKQLTLPAESVQVACTACVHGEGCKGTLVDVDKLLSSSSPEVVEGEEVEPELVPEEDITPPNEISEAEIANAILSGDQQVVSCVITEQPSGDEFVHCDLPPEYVPAEPGSYPTGHAYGSIESSTQAEAEGSREDSESPPPVPPSNADSDAVEAQLYEPGPPPPPPPYTAPYHSVDSDHPVCKGGAVRPTASAGEASPSHSTDVVHDCHEQCCVVNIPPPMMHDGGPASVNIHLISAALREGMNHRPSALSFKRSRRRVAPMARGLVIHCHGGGFVATTTKSHQSYLRQWSIDLQVPVVSIDYSLAPEHPYPRAICDCLHAYAWILENSKMLGTTAEKIVITGDSAGGNLAVALTLAAIELGIRKPDAIMAAYSPFMVELCISPSRLLSVFDPLLPQGILLACLDAYAGSPSTSSKEREDGTDGKANKPSSPLRPQVNLSTTPSRFSFSSVAASVSKSVGWNAGGGMSVQWSRLTSSVSTEKKVVIQAESSTGDQATSVPNSNSPTVERLATSQNSESATTGQEATSADLQPSTAEQVTASPDSIPVNKEQELASLQPVNGKLQPPLLNCQSPSSSDSEFLEVSFADANCAPKCASTTLNSLYEEMFNRQPSPFLSPLRADDEMLKQLPHVDLVACALDPLLDDSIAFSKRLASLQVSSCLRVADSLPHGFLNLAFLSKEARRAYDLCTQCIRNSLVEPQCPAT